MAFDDRTIGDIGVQHPTADLLDTIYLCEQRQDWYREFAVLNHEGPVEIVGSLTTAIPVPDAADSMRSALEFGARERGVVGSNTHRKLNPREFRSFALADQLAPLVFVNGADT